MRATGNVRDEERGLIVARIMERPRLDRNPIFEASVKRLCSVERLKSVRSEIADGNYIPFFLTTGTYSLLLLLRNIAETTNITEYANRRRHSSRNGLRS